MVSSKKGLGVVNGKTVRKIKREIVSGRKCIHDGCDGEVVVARIKKSGHRTLECCKCRKQFAEALGTPFYRLKKPIPLILQTLMAVIEGGGIRAAERTMGIHRDTIMHWLALAGKHAQKVEELLVSQVKASQVQLDELWTFVVKKTAIPVNNYVINGRPWLKELMKKSYQRKNVD